MKAKFYNIRRQPSAAVCLKELAKFIGERDAQVRNAAINTITEAFFQVLAYLNQGDLILYNWVFM